MATTTQRARFWLDTGTTVAVFDNDEVDALFDEAAETYSDADAIKAYTRVLGIQRLLANAAKLTVLGIQRLLANAAKLTDYTQNQSQERQSQVFDHLKSLLSFWQGETSKANANASTSGAARFAGVRRKPKRIMELPGGL